MIGVIEDYGTCTVRNCLVSGMLVIANSGYTGVVLIHHNIGPTITVVIGNALNVGFLVVYMQRVNKHRGVGICKGTIGLCNTYTHCIAADGPNISKTIAIKVSRYTHTLRSKLSTFTGIELNSVSAS